MYPDWVEKVRKECHVSIKESKGFYYAYKCTSNMVDGKRVQSQTYVGRITKEDGLIPAITLSITPLKTEASTIGKTFDLSNLSNEEKKIIKDVIIIKSRKKWYLCKITDKQKEIIDKYNKEKNGEISF